MKANCLIQNIIVYITLYLYQNLEERQFIGYLKGKSALIIFENHADLKYKYGQRTFWAR